MRVCILKSYLGSDRHLLLDTETGTSGAWVKSVPDDAWALGSSVSNHARDLRVLAQYAERDIDWEVPARFRSADEEAGVDSCRFMQTMPRNILLAHVRALLASAESLDSVGSDVYITGKFAETRRQLGDIRAARVDPAVWRDASSDDASPPLASFEPNADGLADPVVYDQLGSLTGRLTVQSGPQILTLRRDLRRIIRPTRRGRRLLMIDFVSHEPRVALSLAGGDPPLDIYGWFQADRMPTSSRDAAKGAIISTLYGMSPSTLSARLDCTLTEARVIIESVRTTFGLDRLEKSLTKEHAIGGTIASAFGRRIRPSSSAPGVLINSYVQSTAYDVAMAGFREILSQCAAALIETYVFFYIHDAMVLEISERDEDRLLEILASPIAVPGFPGSYWAKAKEVTE
jgi:hypothetical protein